ncbi:MAG: hypothetical protein A4E38_00480 [Methanoregulaceae archaeon PtaB.Bin108]|nr:MAG: hypothetical protein A4E38_00480 [Methanoregulaceae archaeon PtaB.Bin108]OPY44661.1 MAG: hypothetical protein A4E42_00998 [Methanoregulaceae archaeon PtaU1.Bin222]
MKLHPNHCVGCIRKKSIKLPSKKIPVTGAGINLFFRALFLVFAVKNRTNHFLKCVRKSLFSSLPGEIETPVFLDERHLIAGTAGVYCKDSPAEVIPAFPEIPIIYRRHEFGLASRAPYAWTRTVHVQEGRPWYQQALPYGERKWSRTVHSGKNVSLPGNNHRGVLQRNSQKPPFFEITWWCAAPVSSLVHIHGPDGSQQ